MLSRRSFFLLSVLYLAAAVSAQNDGEDKMDADEEMDENMVAIETLSGPVNGMKIDPKDDGNEDAVLHYQFLGIPYAEAPIDELRFRDPVPAKPWKKAIDATKFAVVCPQFDAMAGEMTGEEDCLFVNVFTPRLPAQNSGRAPRKSSLLPVIVYLHNAGDYKMGSGNGVPAGLVEKDVIVVTLNYRLGALGFLNLGNSLVSGNMGLKDQLEALKWVQNNIAYFGGDASKVTLAGHSDGAVSAHLHQVAPSGQGLYRAVILMSGTAKYLEYTLKDHKVPRDSMKLVENLECEDSNPSKVLECLQDVEVDQLPLKNVNVFDIFGNLNESENEDEEKKGNATYFMTPSIDSHSPRPFLPRDPELVLSQGQQKDLPVISGFTNGEGGLVLPLIKDKLEELSANWTIYGPHIIFSSELTTEPNPLEQLKANVTKKYYIGNANFTEENLDQAVDMFSDLLTVPILNTLDLQSRTQRSPVYVYEVSQGTSAQLSEAKGVTSGEDQLFIFGDSTGSEGALATDEDKAVADVFNTLLANFAKHQDPTPYFDEDIPMWEAYTADEPSYMEVKGEPEVKEGFNAENLYFWNNVVFNEDSDSPKQQQQQQHLQQQLPAHIPVLPHCLSTLPSPPPSSWAMLPILPSPPSPSSLPSPRPTRS